MPGHVADFYADSVNLPPREARAIGLRQRLALELAWEMLEDAFVVGAEKNSSARASADRIA